MSKFFKSKVKLNQPPPEPRALDVITQEYNNECWALGQLEYQLHILKREVDQRNQRIESLNREGDARKKLDVASAQAAAPQTEAQGAKNEA
jgi:hypothetical protein